MRIALDNVQKRGKKKEEKMNEDEDFMWYWNIIVVSTTFQFQAIISYHQVAWKIIFDDAS